jgi:hypothetical protein
MRNRARSGVRSARTRSYTMNIRLSLQDFHDSGTTKITGLTSIGCNSKTVRPPTVRPFDRN